MNKLKLTFTIIGILILWVITFFVLFGGGWYIISYPFFKILEIILNMGGGG